MTNTPAPLGPIAQSLAKHQSNRHQIAPTQQQSASQPQQKKGQTRFREERLLSWLNLLGVLLVPLMIGIGTILVTDKQTLISQDQHKSDQAIASEQQKAIILKTYMDDITQLLLHEGLRESKADAAVRIIARAKTLVALSQLDGKQKGILIRFLYEAQLIGYEDEQENVRIKISAIISLTSADLSGVDLGRTDLSRADIGWAKLSGADLSGADLSMANLSMADLRWVDLHRANLHRANLNLANLPGADLRGADLSGADLRATLSKATLSKANLSGADLRGAILPGADLGWADLSGADLREADLSGVDLRVAILRGAKVTPQQLAKVSFLKNALLPDGSFYPSSSYPIPNHQEPTN